MAGKSWQPSHVPPPRIDRLPSVEKEEETREREQPLRRVPILKKMLTLKETLTKPKTASTLSDPRTHEVLACGYISKHH